MFSYCNALKVISGRAIRRFLPRIALYTVIFCLSVFCGCTDDNGANPPGDGAIPQIELALISDVFEAPVQITSARDGTARVFIVEQPGKIKIIKNKEVLPAPFLDIQSIVSYGGERGLLSVAFPPGFNNKGYFYVNYTRTGDGATVIARYSVDPSNTDDALEASAEEVLTADQPYPNHNGGMMAFGPDGYLYIALGDGGGAGDPEENAQDSSTVLGSILRIDVESGGSPYDVPDDNPFADRPGFREEIWALGLRNPWRFSFDRTTGDLYIADVGQSLWEEIHVQPASSSGGENYGWNIMEGAHCYSAQSCNQTGLVLPVHEYDHGQGCSITGGYVYRGLVNLNMRGIYFFGDYCSGMIWGLKRTSGLWQAEMILDTDLRIVSFGEDEAGEMYVVNRRGGVYQIREITP